MWINIPGKGIVGVSRDKCDGAFCIVKLGWGGFGRRVPRQQAIQALCRLMAERQDELDEARQQN